MRDSQGTEGGPMVAERRAQIARVNLGRLAQTQVRSKRILALAQAKEKGPA